MRKYIVPFFLVASIGLILFHNFVVPYGVLLFGWTITDDRPYLYLFVFGTYICLISLILQEKDDLARFNLDRVSIWLMVFGGVFRYSTRIRGEAFLRVAIAIMALFLLAALIQAGSRIPKTSSRWVAISLISCLIIIPLAFIDSFSTTRYSWSVAPGALLSDISKMAFFTVSFVAPVEEIMYRAILWGYLRKLGWSETRIFWGQALLFWLIHLHALGTPITFFVTLPATILLQSSGQIFPAIIVHTAVNTILPFLALYFLR
jgi:hypothetical protein